MPLDKDASADKPGASVIDGEAPCRLTGHQINRQVRPYQPTWRPVVDSDAMDVCTAFVACPVLILYSDFVTYPRVLVSHSCSFSFVVYPGYPLTAPARVFRCESLSHFCRLTCSARVSYLRRLSCFNRLAQLPR